MKKFLCLIAIFALVFSGCTDILTENGDYSVAENEQEEYIITGSDVSAEALTAAEKEVKEDGEYITPAHVAAYIHIFGRLPKNYITKSEALKLGWNSKEGNLNEVAPGKSIGGDRFGNYEKLLPQGKYKECDINSPDGKRGAERLVYSPEGDVYYTADHYGSFEKLY